MANSLMRQTRNHARDTRDATPASPRILTRQRELLRLVDAFGGSVGNIDFQKLLLLFSEEHAGGRLYDFVPYRYGAFSFTSYVDRRKLVDRGLLADDDSHWRLTDEGRRAVDATCDMQVGAFVQKYRSLHGDPLVAETYRRFPYYAIRSEIADRVLSGDRTALRKIEAARPRGAAGEVFTIGYEGHTLESYLNTLLRAGATVLCDVRRNAISRKYGFSKGTLSRACAGVGIRYEHLRELGIESERRQGLNSQDDYDALFADYERDSLPNQAAALDRIDDWIRSGDSVALTCYERLPEQCHRHCVSEALETRRTGRSGVRHL
jgi:hypothetical protein